MAIRPVWNGTISFGLLNVPVQLFSGERSVDLPLHQLDRRDRQPIHYQRVNADTGKVVAWEDIVKGFEYERGQYVLVDEEQIRAAAPQATGTVEIESFVERAAIAPMYFEKPYYLVPDRKAEKGYVLLRDTLARTGRVGIARVVIRTRQYLAALMPVEHALVLNLMRFEQQLVPADQFDLPTRRPADYRIAPREMEMAAELIESMSGGWDASQYRDEFRDQLRQIIDEHIAQEHGKPAARPGRTPPPPASTNVVDFMALLHRSLAARGKPASAGKAARSSTGSRRGSAAAHSDTPAAPQAAARHSTAAPHAARRGAHAPTHRHRSG